MTGGGSGTGIAALINGTTDIATASRADEGRREGEAHGRHSKPTRWSSRSRRTASPSIVNEKNPLTALTAEQLQKIYLGDITNWKDVGGPDAPIILYSRESSSGTYVFVKEHLLKGGDYAASAQTLPGTAAVVNAVAKEKNGIGYGGAAYGKGVRELKVKVGAAEVAPTLENVQERQVPALARPLLLPARASPPATRRASSTSASRPRARRIVEKVGYFPLK